MHKKGHIVGRYTIISGERRGHNILYDVICNNCGVINTQWSTGLNICKYCKPRIRKMILKRDYIELQLTGGEYTKIDIEDYEKVRNHCWYKTTRSSVESRINGKLIKIHRFLLNPPNNKVIDHINGDTLDNRRENLRICTNKENLLNQTKVKGKIPFKGVYKRKERDSFVARIAYKGKVYSKESKDLMGAVIWYDKKNIELYGEFSKTNKDLGLY